MGRLLITGGAGFIGSNLARQALDRGWLVRIIDNLSTGSESNFRSLQRLGADVFLGDINDNILLEKCLRDCDAVVHLAAQVSVPQSVIAPSETMKINVDGTANVLNYSLQCGVKKVISASSAAVYGNASDLPLKEIDAGELLSPYAESKWINEDQILQSRKQGLESTALRFFNVFGQGQSPNGAYAAVIPKFVDMLIRNIPPTINGDGLQTRDFVHVDDVCAAIFLLLGEENGKSKHHVYNIATQTQINLLELIEIIKSSVKKFKPEFVDIKPKFTPNRVGDVRNSMASIERINSDLGWSPKTKFQVGIDKLVKERLDLEI